MRIERYTEWNERMRKNIKERKKETKHKRDLFMLTDFTLKASATWCWCWCHSFSLSSIHSSFVGLGLILFFFYNSSCSLLFSTIFFSFIIFKRNAFILSASSLMFVFCSFLSQWATKNVKKREDLLCKEKFFIRDQDRCTTRMRRNNFSALFFVFY